MKTMLKYCGYLLVLFYFQVSGQDTITITDTDLTGGNHSWSNDHVYILDGEITLEEGILDIEAGTMVVARSIPSDKVHATSALNISEGAVLNANGTYEAPIIFAVDSLAWEGIEIEGKPGNSSGSLTYVSIRGAGKSDSLSFGSALTLLHVDKSTVIHHVEILYSGGDGIRLHGGDVNLAYAVVTSAIDDAFDYDFGWSGHGIFWYANTVGTGSYITLPADPGSFAIEGRSYIDAKDTFISNPIIYHATLVGESCPSPGWKTRGALGLLNGAQGTIANSAFMNFPDHGLYIEDLKGKNDSYSAMENGQLNLLANVWHDFGRDSESIAGNKFLSGAGGMILTNSLSEDPEAEALVNHLLQHQNIISDFGTIKNLGGTCRAIDPRLDPKNDHSSSPNITFPNTEFFNQYLPQDEKGAFSSTLWIRDWTALDQVDSLFRVGEEGYGSYLFKGKPLNETDTIIVSCDALPILQDSLIYVFPCNPYPYQIGVAHRKGNPRRSRPKNRSDELEYAFIEQWEYRSTGSGCSAISELHLVVLVLDTVAPIIHPVPVNGGLGAVTEDCDESWITETRSDTIIDDGDGSTKIKYTFFAEDYSGNESTLLVELKLDKDSTAWYADFDRDGYGNPLLMIHSADSIIGFVQNDDDCNDSDPYAFPGSTGPFGYSAYIHDCNMMPESYDLCEIALELSMGSTCSFAKGDLEIANPTIYPVLSESCHPSNFRDVWVKTVLPASGGMHIRIQEDLNLLVDTEGFTRIFAAEIFSGDCQQLVLENCMVAEGSTLYHDFEDPKLVGQELYIRIMEAGNTSYSPFEICLVDLAEKVNNDFCSTAHGLEVQELDSCTMMTFGNYNAASALGNVISDCHETYSPFDVWFKFMTPDADSIQFNFDTVAGSAFNKPIATFYRGDCGQMTEVACFNHDVVGNSFVGWIGDFNPGEEIIVRLYDRWFREGEFKLSFCYLPETSVGVMDQNAQGSFSVYPNPTSSEQLIHIDISNLTLPWNRVIIRDIHGRVIKSIRKSSNLRQESNFTLEPLEIKAGIYFIQINTTQGILTEKLVIMD